MDERVIERAKEMARADVASSASNGIFQAMFTSVDAYVEACWRNYYDLAELSLRRPVGSA